ncbi:MAG: universal stress protein [Pseudomonadota bacterium]
MFQTIVVGVDGSEPSDKALRMACDLARKYDAILHLVHSPQQEATVFASAAVVGLPAVADIPTQVSLDALGQAILSQAKAIAAECGRPDVHTHLLQGDPGDEIVECAVRVDADLIVTGRLGLGNLAGLVLGSTTQRIMHDAKCAVLTVA